MPIKPVWADCLRMVHYRRPDIAETMITQLEVGIVPCFQGVRRLVEDAGLEVLDGIGRNTSAGVGPRTGPEQSFVHTQVWPGLNDPTRDLNTALLLQHHGTPDVQGHQV